MVTVQRSCLFQHQSTGATRRSRSAVWRSAVPATQMEDQGAWASTDSGAPQQHLQCRVQPQSKKGPERAVAPRCAPIGDAIGTERA